MQGWIMEIERERTLWYNGLNSFGEEKKFIANARGRNIDRLKVLTKDDGSERKKIERSFLNDTYLWSIREIWMKVVAQSYWVYFFSSFSFFFFLKFVDCYHVADV